MCARRRGLSIAVSTPETIRRGRLGLFPIAAILLGAVVAAMPSVSFAQGEAEVVQQMFQDCIDSGGQPSGRNYNDWVSNGGCICPGSPVGSGQVTCSGGNNAGATSSGDAAEQLGSLLGTVLACKLFNQCPPGMRPPPDNSAVRNGLSQANASRHAMLDQADREEARRVAAARQRMLDVMQNGSDGLYMHSLDANPDTQRSLQGKTVPGPMGTHEVKPIFVSRNKDGDYLSAGLSPVQRLSCAYALQRGATDMELPFSYRQRIRMSGDSVNYLSGLPSKSPCPTDVFGLPPAPPTPTAVEVQTKQMKVKGRLYLRIYKGMSRVNSLKQRLEADKKKHNDASKAIAKAKERVAELKSKVDTAPSSPGKTEHTTKDDILLKEAQAALDKSNDALQKIDKDDAQNTSKLNKLTQQMRKDSQLLEDVNQHPNHADDLLRRLE